MNTSEINVGIDTSSKQLDMYVRPTGQFFSVNNDTSGIKEAIKQLQTLKPARVLIESTERLEIDFVSEDSLMKRFELMHWVKHRVWCNYRRR